jgi:hypothetical protein
MNTTTLFTKSVLRIALLAMLVSLAGCGSDDKEPTYICLVLLIIPVACSVGTPSPPSLEPPPPPPAPPPSNSDGESNTSGGNNTGPRTLTMARVAEFEPNNTLDNANVVQFRIAPIEHSVGIDINGSVQETDDQSDFFIFTPNRSDRHGIYLCAETCGAFLEDDAVYIMLYDQHQTTIVSTPVGTVAEQMVTAELTAGLAYYVEVRGVKTGSTPYPYQLIIVD